MLKVIEAMTKNPTIATPGDTVEHAARRMEEIDAGILPVGDGDRLVGMITDRDLAIRVVAKGLDPKKTRVGDVMSAEVKYCYEDEDLNHVVENMADLQVRRLPVLNREKRLVGIVSLGDIAASNKPIRAGAALRGIAQPSSQHNQSAAHAGGKPTR
jgi:CBS domain-containing protein